MQDSEKLIQSKKQRDYTLQVRPARYLQGPVDNQAFSNPTREKLVCLRSSQAATVLIQDSDCEENSQFYVLWLLHGLPEFQGLKRQMLAVVFTGEKGGHDEDS